MLLREAASKADFATYLWGPIRQSVRRGYQRVQPQYKRYVGIESAQDFREHRVVGGLGDFTGMGYLGDHGEYPEGHRRSLPARSFVVDTYGMTYSLTRQLIRNDDTGQIMGTTPEGLGRAAGRFVMEAVVALIESNPLAADGVPVFADSRGNQTTADISEEALAVGVSAMEGQVDDEGVPIVITPSILVVKSALQQLIANRAIRSGQTAGDPAGAADTQFARGTDNVVANIMPANSVIRDPYFSDHNDWFLFADPNEVPAFVAAFLDGNEQPFVGVKNSVVTNALGAGDDPYEYDIDTLDYKVRLDFGVAVADPRGAYRGVVA
jgi:phage major head subunit gpT-like protein